MGGGSAWEGEERRWVCGGEQRGEPRLVALKGDGGELRDEAGEEAEEHGGEEDEEVEEERLLSDRSTGWSSWGCVGLLGVWDCVNGCMW